MSNGSIFHIMERIKPQSDYTILFHIILKNGIFSVITYFIGYIHWSIIWIVIPLILSSLITFKRNKHNSRRDFVREAADGREKEIILQNFTDLPAWVYFPDVERAEWINKIIKQFWPSVNFYARELMQNLIERKLRKNLEKYALKGFYFERIILGSVPFRTGGIIVYDNIARDEVVMDVDISYAGDCDIKFRLRGLVGGLKNFQMYGKLRIVLKPLIRTFPLLGGLQVFFLNNPDIEFELDGIAGILDIPGINESLRKCVIDTISSLMVLPNKFPIKLSRDVNIEKLSTPDPKGVLRVHVIEARDLEKKDITFTGKGKSDPYAILEVGDQRCKTSTIDCNINPKWDYWCEFVILERYGQELVINVWDEDQTEDEFLGRTSVEIISLIKEGQSDLWLTLEDVKHGDIHIRCTWLSLTTDYSNLQAALYESQQLQVSHMSSALLIVFIDSAANLRQVKTSTKPDPYVQLQLGRQYKNTNVIMRSVNPVWEEGFIFLLSNPDSDYLNLKIVDFKTETSLNEVNYNISHLCDKDSLEVLNEPLRLDNGTSESKLVWSLHLKIFKNENFQEYLEKRGSVATEVLDKPKPEEDQNSSSSSLSEVSVSTVSEVSSNPSRSSSIKSQISGEEKINTKHIRLSSEPIGKISLTMRYSLQRQRLIVVVHSISGLQYEGATDTKDLYIKIYLLPERNKATKRKTQVIKECQNPTFDKRFEFLVPQGELNSKKLELSVIEERTLKNATLGQVIIDLRGLNLPHTGFFDLGPKIKKD